MSLLHSPEGEIDRKILQAAATAIRSIETVTGTIVEYSIGKDDALLLNTAIRNLWSILETSGYTIDTDTNRFQQCYRHAGSYHSYRRRQNRSGTCVQGECPAFRYEHQLPVRVRRVRGVRCNYRRGA